MTHDTSATDAGRFHLVAVNRATRREVRLTLTSLTKRECETMKTKQSRNPRVTYEIRPVDAAPQITDTAGIHTAIISPA
jgi:hypothetical protein